MGLDQNLHLCTNFIVCYSDDPISPDSTPVLKNLLDALCHTAADKWQVLGAHLHIPVDTLQTIAARHQHDPQHCLGEVLKAWLQGADTSTSWGPVIKAVESLGEESEERP